ncbi:uncharacterized protein IL334_006459 [Kwoniella shivajii]|uniref:Uncharacterized protein n=1 Tax=Kwoniella shivajii TaxID=564305 RepID=A0ABZ1D609_9TREE|nr:hypothetical protein IL334_006459 [Kwoniella shivajii]
MSFSFNKADTRIICSKRQPPISQQDMMSRFEIDAPTSSTITPFPLSPPSAPPPASAATHLHYQTSNEPLLPSWHALPSTSDARTSSHFAQAPSDQVSLPPPSYFTVVGDRI